MIKINTKRGLINGTLAGLLVFGVAGCQNAPLNSKMATEAETAMPVHPFLADSTYSIYHANMAMSASQFQAGPVSSVSRQLSENEIRYTDVGSFNFLFPTYSSPYPDGKRVIWLGGIDRVVKLDTETWQVISSYKLPGTEFMSSADSRALEQQLDGVESLDDLMAAAGKFKSMIRQATATYHFLDNNNEFYVFSGPQSIAVYGDVVTGDSRSGIELKREWKIPKGLSRGRLMGSGITYDGKVVLLTNDGVLIALSTDFSRYVTLDLPGRQQALSQSRKSFVRNSFAIDDEGGIYVAGGDYLSRVQWNGESLSLNPKEGAWSVQFSNDTGTGTGTTPTLMGFGTGKDKLVLIGDGNEKGNLQAFWRDRIPADWHGLPGQDRRLAASVPVTYGRTDMQRTVLENSPSVAGYSVLVANTDSPSSLSKTDYLRYIAATGLVGKTPGFIPQGMEKFEWDTDSRTLRSVWTNAQINNTTAIPLISEDSNLVYNIGVRGDVFTLEALDWQSGEPAYHYNIGASQRFNPFWGAVTLMPDGTVAYSGTFGAINLRPQQ